MSALDPTRLARSIRRRKRLQGFLEKRKQQQERQEQQSKQQPPTQERGGGGGGQGQPGTLPLQRNEQQQNARDLRTARRNYWRKVGVVSAIR